MHACMDMLNVDACMCVYLCKGQRSTQESIHCVFETDLSFAWTSLSKPQRVICLLFPGTEVTRAPPHLTFYMDSKNGALNLLPVQILY